MSDDLSLIRSFPRSPRFPELHSSCTVSYDTDRGRCITALRDIPSGTIVCVEKGITVNISSSLCYFCLRLAEKTSKFCEECKSSQNLTEEPRELSDGKFDELGIFKLAAHVVLSYPFQQVFEAVNAPEPVPPTWAPSKLSTSDFKSILQLRPMKEVAEVLEVPEITEAIKLFSSLLAKHPSWGKLDESKRYIAFSKVLRLVAERSAKNSHVVYSVTQTMSKSCESPMGTGMFPIASIFNHSCTPNVFAFFVRNNFIFVSLGVRAGEELCDSYGVTAQQNSFARRQEFLREHSGFECACMTCRLYIEKKKENHLLISNMRHPEEIVKSTTNLDDFDLYSAYIEPGHKDFEELSLAFLEKYGSQGSAGKRINMWRDFVQNSRVRGIIFDSYHVRPWLEIVLAYHENELISKIEENSDEIKSALFCVHQIIHVFYADLHPAFRPVESLLKIYSRKGSTIENDCLAEIEILKKVVAEMRPDIE